MTDLFSSEQVRLRALEPEDLDFLYLWENDAELRESGNMLVPIGRNRLKEYIEKSSEGLMELGRYSNSPSGLCSAAMRRPHS